MYTVSLDTKESANKFFALQIIRKMLMGKWGNCGILLGQID